MMLYEKKDMKLDISCFTKMSKKTKDRYAMYLIDLLYDSCFDRDGEYLLDERLKLEPMTLKVVLPYLWNQRIGRNLVSYQSRRRETAKSLFHVLDLSNVVVIVDYDDLEHKYLRDYHTMNQYTNIHGVRLLFGNQISCKRYMTEEDIKMLREEIELSKQEKKEHKPYVKTK